MSKTAEQAVHDRIWQIVSPMVNDNVYESRPMTEVDYPFSDFEDCSTGFSGTKNGTTARVILNLNIWDIENNRKKVSEIGSEILRQSMLLKEAFGYPVTLRISDSTVQMLHDRTVRPYLWRCMVHLEFEI
ncbi:MAG: hypothetical protein QM793_14175 [Muricomes sp.]